MGKASEPSELRITAFKCISILAIQDRTLISILLNLIKKEENPYIRLQFIKTWDHEWEQFLYCLYYDSQIKLEKKKNKEKKIYFSNYFTFHKLSFQVVDMIFLFKKRVNF